MFSIWGRGFWRSAKGVWRAIGKPPSVMACCCWRPLWTRSVFAGRCICVLGAVGSGKSTLVDYYLRCYCGTKGRNRAEFDKKLIVHFDSKVIQDNTDFYHDFF